MGQKGINEQTDEHRRQGHQRIDNCPQRFFPFEVEIAEAKSKGYPYQQAASNGIARHFDGSPYGRIRFRVAAEQQIKGLEKSFQQKIHNDNRTGK